MGNPKSGQGYLRGVRLRELSVAKLKSQFKRGFTKVVVTRAGPLREWSQGVSTVIELSRNPRGGNGVCHAPCTTVGIGFSFRNRVWSCQKKKVSWSLYVNEKPS